MRNSNWSYLLLSLLAVVLIGMWVTGKYNNMVKKDENVNNAWASVESAYQRRADLIPNLVNTVKGYADFEQSTLEGVISARAAATQVKIDPTNMTPAQMQQFQEAQGNLGSALGRLLVSVERYPELKANEQFLKLQDQLEGTENRIKVERDRYNAVVKDWNQYIRAVPNNFIAGIFGFGPEPYFESEESAAEAPTVEF